MSKCAESLEEAPQGWMNGCCMCADQKVSILEAEIERLEAQVAALLDLIRIQQAVINDQRMADIATCDSWKAYRNVRADIDAALAASPAAKPNCETCGKPHPCWCPAPDARPAAKEKENAGK